MKQSHSSLPARLLECNSEEEVKSEFARAFKLKIDTRQRMDLYTQNILYEFKYEKNLNQMSQRAQFVAQLLYYVRELKFGATNLSIPKVLCVVDRNEAFFVSTVACKAVYDNADLHFDWDRAASTPCPNVVAAVAKIKAISEAKVHNFGNKEDFENFVRQHEHYMSQQPELDFSQIDKKVISEHNFESAFKLWSEQFADYVKDDRKASEYFMIDIQKGKSQILAESQEVAFEVAANLLERKPLPISKYKNFWANYEKVPNSKAMHAIWQRFDRLTKEDFRRFTGEFYTPVKFASKAISYLERELGENWWDKGYRLWDMASGTGNLEYEIPEEALPYCYISTLLEEDAKYCSQMYPTATVFQYDYLNDDVNLLHSNELDLVARGISPKMPESLYRDLQDPNIKWIVFINPPFATANVAQTTGSIQKDGVSMTQIRRLMSAEDLGEVSRELFSQFLWRINREFMGRSAVLGMFSTLKYINSNNDQKLRDKVFRYEFLRGFCLPAKSFHGNKGEFPIGFLLWNLAKSVDLLEQKIVLDVFSLDVEKIGTKEIPSISRSQFLSKWIERPKTSSVMPPFSSAITPALGKKDVRDRVAEGFLFSHMVAGNDYQHQNITYFLSGPAVSAGAYSVTAENFEKSLVVHAVRLVKRSNWLNDRDQWFQPNVDPLPEEFVNDCVMWSLFSSSNQVVAMDAIPYKGVLHPIDNQLYPFLKSEVEEWECSLSTLANSIQSRDKDRFAALWLEERELSIESQAVLDSAKNLYKKFYKNSSSLPWPQYKISKWDSGWYQVRRSLADTPGSEELLANQGLSHAALGRKLVPQLESLGFVTGLENMFADAMIRDSSSR
jgi:hypothetical protein